MKIGVLTGGGDCPGLNAAIRAVVRVAEAGGDEVIGFHHGWRGVVEGESHRLTTAETKGILQAGGTILRTARFHPNEHEGGVKAVFTTVAQNGVDALIVIGGDGTLQSAHRLAEAGVPLVGIPKTIDNDVAGTRRCIGFDTAVQTATEAIDRVQTTGESHDRLMIVEVMGRSTGWLALCSGIAAGADAICIPERPTNLSELTGAICRRHASGSSSSVVVVAEGTHLEDATLHVNGSVGSLVAKELESRSGFETRLTVLGHIQRGGPPVASDRLLATRFGVAAVEAVRAKDFGTMICVVEEAVETTPLAVLEGGPRSVPPELLSVVTRLTIS
jgi:6-phosphofructokinase 1